VTQFSPPRLQRNELFSFSCLFFFFPLWDTLECPGSNSGELGRGGSFGKPHGTRRNTAGPSTGDMSGSRAHEGSKWSMQAAAQRSSLLPAERMHGAFRATAQPSANWTGPRTDRGLLSLLSSASPLATRAKQQMAQVGPHRHPALRWLPGLCSGICLIRPNYARCQDFSPDTDQVWYLSQCCPWKSLYKRYPPKLSGIRAQRHLCCLCVFLHKYV